MKGKLIIIEGAQGSGKTTTTNLLRERILSSDLVRLTGLPDKSKEGELKNLKHHYNTLNMIKKNAGLGLNYILDRSYLSEKVYCDLGYKKYSFEVPFCTLSSLLLDISKLYDLKIVLLKCNVEDYEKRLKRDKAEYVKFNKKESKKQESFYIKNLEYIKNVYSMDYGVVPTTSLNPEEVVDTIMGWESEI